MSQQYKVVSLPCTTVLSQTFTSQSFMAVTVSTIDVNDPHTYFTSSITSPGEPWPLFYQCLVESSLFFVTPLHLCPDP